MQTGRGSSPDSTTRLSLLKRLDSFLSASLIFLIPSCFPLGYLFRGFMPQLKWTATYMLFTIMFASAYGLRLKDFFALGEKKKIVFFSIASQLLALPVISDLVSLFLYGGKSPWRVGHLCVAASPAAISTIIWSRISNGDVALAVVLVGINVLLIPFAAPAILKIFIGKNVDVPVGNLFLKLFFSVFLPTILAVLLFEKKRSEKPKTLFSAWAKLGMLYMIVLNTSVAFASVPLGLETLKVLSGMMVQVLFFYLTGLLLGRALCPSRKTRITLSYFMGMKNNGAGLVMALSGFPLEATLPVALAIMCQQPIASIMDRIWRKNASSCPDPR